MENSLLSNKTHTNSKKIPIASKDPVSLVIQSGSGSILYLITPGSPISSDHIILALSLLCIFLAGTTAYFYGKYRKTLKNDKRQNPATSPDENFKSLCEYSPDAMLLSDFDGKLIDCNQKTTDLLGYTKQEIQGMNLSKLITPDQIQKIKHLVFENSSTSQISLEVETKAGSTMEVDVNVAKTIQNGRTYFLSAIRDGSEKNKAEKTILEKSEQLNAFLEASMEGFWVVDLMGNLKLVNNTYCAMSGFSREELLKLNIRDLEVLESNDEIHDHILRIVKQGSDVFETKHKRKDGSVYDVAMSVSFISSRNEISGFARDITAYKHSKQKLIEASERFRLAEMAGNMGAWEWKMKTDEAVWSENLYRILEYEKDEIEMTGTFLLNTVHPEDRDAYDKVMESAIRERKDFQHAFRIVKKGGDISWVTEDAIIFYDSAGTPERMVGMTRIIDETKNTEMELKLMEKAFHNSLTGLAITKANGAITNVNDAFAKMWGYNSKEEIMDMHSSDFWITKNHVNDIIKELKNEETWAGEKIAMRNDGSCFSCWISANYLLDEKGEVSHMIGSFWDITPQKEYEKEMQNSIAEKDVLLKEVQHRVKNNLQIISSLIYLQSLQIKDKAMEEFFTLSLNRIKSMALVHEYLYQTKNFNKINFKLYITELAYLTKETYNGKTIEINVDINEGDTIPFNQAIYCGLLVNELLSNAFKHAFKAKESGQVIIGFKKHQAWNTLIVADNGIGMTDLGEIKKGTTLGYRIIEELTDQLKGNIDLKNTKGTRVEIHFPQNI